MSTQWGQFSNEEAATGAFFSRLNGSFEDAGWRVKIEFVEFSKQAKEPEAGADVAVIVDALAANGQRSFKTMWFQAKMAETLKSSSSLPRMSSQLSKAEAYCQASYGLVYTSSGILVIRSGDVESFHETLDRCIRCEVGDTTIPALKNSLNRKRLLQLLVTQEPVKPVRRLNVRGR